MLTTFNAAIVTIWVCKVTTRIVTESFISGFESLLNNFNYHMYPTHCRVQLVSVTEKGRREKLLWTSEVNNI